MKPIKDKNLHTPRGLKENKQSEDWVEIISSATKLDEEFKADPNKWCVDLRDKCKRK
jgi:uncharacterized protein YeaO (DUF488 family)